MVNQIVEQSVLTFNGQKDYIDFGRNDVGGVFAEGSSAFTISGWVNPHQLTNQATTYGTRNVFFARSSDRYSDNFEFGISEAGNLDIYIDETVSKYVKTFGNRELTIGQWHFFAIIFNQGQVTVYLDGHEYGESFTGTSLNKATSSVTLGATLHNHIYFTGQLAHISIWNYPCTQEQIQNQRSGLIVGDEPGLIAYWKLDEGEGKTVKSQTSNSYQGTVRGNPSWDLTQIPFVEQSSNEGEIISETATNFQEDVAFLTTTTVLANEESETIPKEETKTDQTKVPINTQLAQTLIQEESSETMNNTSQPKYKILAIDGGGIRGIIPALLLAEIERRTQKPISSLFDLIAGTSSGGILALGLTKPRLNTEVSDNLSPAEYTAEDLFQLFLEYGAEIFYEPLFEKILGPLEDFFLPKYSSESREEILKQYFGNSPLENNLKEVFVTSYDIEHRIPILFTNKSAKQNIESKNFRNFCGGFSLLDAALATSATPTYFAPHRIVNAHNNDSVYTLIDGGVIANNPAHLAILEAQISNRQQANRVINTEDIVIVSLGTGSLTSAFHYSKVKNWGLLQWGRPLLNIVFDGGSEVVAGELERLFAPNNEEKSSYYRFQTFLDGDLEELDNTKLNNTRQLQATAHRMIAENGQKIDELCSVLLS
ncbi:patatin-like phospholipase family protein [Halotia branconii]|uniref:Patatin-like phospholipase family protein n=1 Tax=Halotia branconii CENA392 TaxID=1539056 RepID=A0AAJ6NRK6_9CYAN|nr:patatin-like phospholipase family protein [Halotia branconii]WGV25113.1 patatin-like phospholipase family protein [Halotia branconii CENA392]